MTIIIDFRVHERKRERKLSVKQEWKRNKNVLANGIKTESGNYLQNENVTAIIILTIIVTSATRPTTTMVVVITVNFVIIIIATFVPELVACTTLVVKLYYRS